MKTFFTSLILSVISLISFGQYSQVGSQLVTVNFIGDKNFQAIIDGQTFYSDGKDGKWDDNRNDRWDNSRGNNKKYDDNDIKLNLAAGQHSITVYKMVDNSQNRNNNGNGRGNNNGNGRGNSNGNDRGNNNGQWGRNASQANRVVYTSTFILKQGYDMHFEIEGNGRAQITEERNRNSWNRGNGRNNNGGNNNGGNNNGGYNNGGNNNGGYNNGNNNGGYNNGYPNNRYRTPMADNQFSQVYQAVKGKWFQSGKVSAVRDDFSNTTFVFSTYQARQLLLLISSEGDKLELAKLAFDNIADPQNFSQLYDIFNSQFSRDELDKYTRGRRF